MSSFNKIEPPLLTKDIGSYHPINQVKSYLIDYLKQIGFNEIEGPEIESEEFNFDMLNIKESHPAQIGRAHV